MESKLNLDKINSYSIDFANIICNRFFADNKKISGQEILSVTPLKQVNLFVLKHLFEIWGKENEKLKSKYFDYDSSEVKAALSNLMNILSQNISISKEDFQPLLIRATSDTLLIILSPYAYYNQEINSSKSGTFISYLKNLAKYVHINKHLISDLIAKVENINPNEIDARKCLALFDEVCEQSSASPEDIEEHLKTLSQIKPILVEEFYPKENEIPQVSQRDSENNESKKILAELFTVDAPTLHEKYASESQESSLAEKLQKSKIQSIKSSIPINQKFLYINELFNGNIQDFAMTIDEIEECTNLEQVKGLISSKFLPKYRWNLDNDTFKDFLQTVERKFI